MRNGGLAYGVTSSDTSIIGHPDTSACVQHVDVSGWPMMDTIGQTSISHIDSFVNTNSKLSKIHIKEGVINLSLHPFLSRRIHTKLYERALSFGETTFHIGKRVLIINLHTISQLALCIYLVVQKPHLPSWLYVFSVACFKATSLSVSYICII